MILIVANTLFPSEPQSDSKWVRFIIFVTSSIEMAHGTMTEYNWLKSRVHIDMNAYFILWILKIRHVQLI